MWILIIEDDPIQARVYGRYLEKAGYLTLVATDGATGVHQALQMEPDAVLLDIMLPNVSGIEVLKQIRAKKPDLPVVAYTNGFAPILVDEVMAAGATHILNKIGLDGKELARLFDQQLRPKAA